MDTVTIHTKSGHDVTIDTKDAVKIEGKTIYISKKRTGGHYALIKKDNKLTTLSTVLYNTNKGIKLVFKDGNSLNYSRNNVSIQSCVGVLQAHNSKTCSISVKNNLLLFDREDFLKLAKAHISIKNIKHMQVLVSITLDGKKSAFTLQKFLWGCDRMSVISKTGCCTDFRRASVDLVPYDCIRVSKNNKCIYSGVSYVPNTKTYTVDLQYKRIRYIVLNVESEFNACILSNYIKRELIKTSARLNKTYLSIEEEHVLAVSLLKTHKLHTYNIKK